MNFLEKNKKIVYVDYNATAPIRPEAKGAIMDVLGNPIDEKGPIGEKL